MLTRLTSSLQYSMMDQIKSLLFAMIFLHYSMLNALHSSQLVCFLVYGSVCRWSVSPRLCFVFRSFSRPLGTFRHPCLTFLTLMRPFLLRKWGWLSSQINVSLCHSFKCSERVPILSLFLAWVVADWLVMDVSSSVRYRWWSGVLCT